MRQYYYHNNGKEQGPFSLEEMLRQDIHPETPVWYTGINDWTIASEIEELKRRFTTKPPPLSGRLSSIDTTRKRASGKRSWIWAVVIAAALMSAAAGAIYLMRSKPAGASLEKEDVKAIHEREVRRAMQDLAAQKLAKKRADERRALLHSKQAELQNLNAQLEVIRERKAEAQEELEDIRRPHLFRSRARREEEVAAQLDVIEKLESKASSLRTKIARCETAIDTLSIPSVP